MNPILDFQSGRGSRTSRTMKRNAKARHLLLRPHDSNKPKLEKGQNGGEESIMAQCSHLNHIRITSSEAHVCEECIKIGDRWVHLRLCLECGHVGCCDS